MLRRALEELGATRSKVAENSELILKPWNITKRYAKTSAEILAVVMPRREPRLWTYKYTLRPLLRRDIVVHLKD